MLFKSQVYTQASGSIGGVTYSRNKGGMYTRGRAIPTNPQTARQLNIRDMMSFYSQYWLSTLTQAERDAWDTFAANVLVTNRLGDQIQISGQNHFLRVNVPRGAANSQISPATDLTTVEAAPTVFDLPTLSPPTITTVSISLPGVTFAWDDTPTWVNVESNALLVYMGKPRNASRNFFKGPYRLLGMVQGDDVAAPTSPTTLVPTLATWPGLAVGQKVKFKFVLTIGSTDTEPTGQSTPTYADAVVVS